MQQVNIEEFTVIGPQVRTNNAQEATDSGKIGGLWAQFHASSPHLEADVYGVYSDYESDASGEFTVTAGIRTPASAKPSVHVNAGTYLVFPANGQMPAAIIDAWKTVWQHFASQPPYTRAYETDFEAYTGPTSAALYIGIVSDHQP